MLDSKPKEREGEPIESLLLQTIDATASSSRSRTGEGEPPRRGEGSHPQGAALRRAVVELAAIALLEALALVALPLSAPPWA